MTSIDVYTKSYCPYCKAAKQTLTRLGLSYREIEVSEDAGLLAEMLERSQRRTVPQIFIGDTHVGGNQDLQEALANGRLEKILNDQRHAA